MVVTGKKKDVFPQTLKGLCIIFVVLIHLPWGQDGEWTAYLWIAIRKIINISVATFFFISAYYTNIYNEIRGSVLNYYSKRLKRLLIPYLIWSIVYVFLIPIATTGHISDNWVYLMLTGKGPTYFLLALAQFTLLNPLLQKYKNNKYANWIFWTITPLYLLFYYTYNFHMGKEFKPEQFFCFPWFACYYLGLKMQDSSLKSKIEELSSTMVLFCAIGVLMLSIVEASFIYTYTSILSFAISQITIGSVLFSLVILLFVVTTWHEERNNKRNFLTNIGDFSMGIFLMHPFYNWVFKFIFLHFPGGMDLYKEEFGFMSIHMAILMLSVAASYFSAKILATKFPRLTPILGLR